MSSTTISVRGLEKTIASLQAMPEAIMKNIVSKAVKAATEPILLKAQDLCPVRYGFLKRRIVSRVVRIQGGKSIIGKIGVEKGPRIPLDGDIISRGPNKGRALYVQPTKYAHFVEMGTSTREATPFLRPALQAQAQVAVGRFQAVCEDGLDTAVLKAVYGHVSEYDADTAALKSAYGKV
jgi:HK97 gp10 family phage protein